MQRFQPADSENHSAARALSGPSSSGKARNIMRSRSQGDKPLLPNEDVDGHVFESGCLRYEDGRAEIQCPATRKWRRNNELACILHPSAAIVAKLA